MSLLNTGTAWPQFSCLIYIISKTEFPLKSPITVVIAHS